LSLTVQLVSVAVPLFQTPPPKLAELPLMVQLVSVVAPLLYRPPPEPEVEPPLIVRPESAAVTPLPTSNTLTVPPPLTVTSPASVSSIISGPAVSESTRVAPSVIVCGEDELNSDESNSISLPSVLVLALAWEMTYGSVPDMPEPEVLFPVESTVKIIGERTTRDSSNLSRGR
jgi:hypothetical protein